MPFQELRDLLRRLDLGGDSDVHRFQPLQQQPRIERAERGAGVTQEGRQRLGELVVAQDGAAQAAALAVDVLGGRIDHDIGAELQRTLKGRGREHVVHDDARTRRMGQFADQRQIDHVEHRVRRRLQEDDVGRAAQRRAPLIGVGAVDQRGLDAELRGKVLDDVQTGAEQRMRRHDPVARLQLAHQRREHRRHAAGRGEAALGALVGCKPVLEHGDGRVAEARIDEPGAVVGEGGFRFLRRAVDEAGGHEDRFAGLVEAAPGGARVNHPGARAQARGVLRDRVL